MAAFQHRAEGNIEEMENDTVGTLRCIFRHWLYSHDSNASEQTVDGALMAVPEIGEAKELWMNIPVQNRDGSINGSIGSNEVMIV